MPLGVSTNNASTNNYLSAAGLNGAAALRSLVFTVTNAVNLVRDTLNRDEEGITGAEVAQEAGNTLRHTILTVKNFGIAIANGAGAAGSFVSGAVSSLHNSAPQEPIEFVEDEGDDFVLINGPAVTAASATEADLNSASDNEAAQRESTGESNNNLTNSELI